MAEQEESAEKSFDPTPRKLQEARKRGEIVRSSDLNTAVTYAGLLLSLTLFAPPVLSSFGKTMQNLIAQADTVAPMVTAPGGASVAGNFIFSGILLISSIILIPAALLLVSLVAQRAIIFTPSRLEFKFSRISIFQGAKNKFGMNGIFEFLKSSAKLLIYTTLLGLFLIGSADEIIGSLQGSARQVIGIISDHSRSFLIFVFIVAVFVGIIDYFWQYHSHIRKNRMTRKEISDESKENDGDPHLKQERRQRGYEIATNRMLADVPNAAVVIVNPTHYAVALQWDRKSNQVPICVAKGVDEMAARIREAANAAAVPIFSDPETARALHKSLEIGAPIERSHFRAVAAAMRFSDLMRHKVRQGWAR